MKRLALVIGLFLLMTTSAYADPLTFSFSSVEGAALSFNGTGGFGFVFPSTGPSAGWDFVITLPLGNSMVGMNGQLYGTFAIGAISSCGLNCESAPVTTLTSGEMWIWDGTGDPNLDPSTWFSANLEWVSILTIGTSGAINSSGTVNLTNFSYTGTNVDLAAFAGAGPNGITSVTFQFVPAATLNTLATNPAVSSYSGTVTAVPEPGTLMLLGAGLLGLAGLRRKLS